MEPLENRLLMRSSPWGAWSKFIYQDAAVASFPKLTGKGEAIAILDTGIANVPSLKGKIVGGRNILNNSNNYTDTDGHGTSVAGVIAASAFTFNGNKYQGIAPGVKLLAVKIDDGSDNPTPANIQAGLQWVLNNAARYNIVAVNISEGDNNIYTDHGASSIYSAQLAALAGQGIFVAAAAGNDGNSSGVEYPAADPNVASISSVNLSDQVSSFSNTGLNVDLLAPGESIVTPGLVNGRATYIIGQGTSYSAPMAVATAALIRQASTRFSVRDILSIEQNTPFQDVAPGNGLAFPRLDLFNSLYVATHSVGSAAKKVFA